MQHIDIRRRAVWDAHTALRTHLSATPLPSVQKAVREVLREGRAAAAAAVHQQRQDQLESLSAQDASASGGVTLGVPAEAFRADSSSGGASPLQEDFIVVTRDRNGTVEMPTFALDHGLVHVTASSAFTSVLYRSVLASGRWCYEVTLGTEGLVQIGWCPPQDLQQWNTKLGVGDFMHSMGFDGSRDRVWHGQGRELVKGAAWMEGDIVTCCVDLDASVVTYYLNGRLAWSGNVHTLSSCRADLDEEAAPYYVMCAGVSSAAAERYTLNVGHSPLAFPPPGYTPLASLPYMTAAAAQGVLSTSIPPYLDAHVIAEAACAITHILEPALAADESATILTRKRRNLALAALVDEMPPATLDCLGAALCAAFLRSAATAETNSSSSLTAHHDDTPMKTTASDIVVALGAFLPSTCTPDLFRSVLSYLSYIARGVTFPVPSRAEQNRYSRAAMRLVVHLVQNHYELMCEAWPPSDDPVQFDHAVAPFYRAKAPSRAVRDELIADVDLTAPLKDVRLRDAAAALGDDLYTQLMPYAEALFSTLYSHRPVAVTEFATRVGERHENAGSSGVMLWTVLARVILSRTASLTTEQVVEEWCNRRKLLSERGATVEGRRLGGSPSTVLRRCSVGHPRVPATDVSGDPLLIVVSWLFHYCARRQFPAILNDLASLRQHAQILARGDGDTADATLKVNTLVRVALVQRSRMANKGFIDTLFGFNDLLFRIMDHFANKAMLVTLPTPSSSEPSPTAVPDMLAAGVTFRKVTPTEPVVDFMLIPQGFVATTAVILQLTRRAMPTAYAAWLASAPHAFRFSIIAALSPVVDQSENAVEGILHLATLLLESPCPDPIPHSRTVAQTVTSDYVAYFMSKCFLQMSNDFSWSMAVNALSCLNTGNSLLQPRSTDPLSDGWLSWEDQIDHSEQHVPPTPRSSAFGLFRDAVRLLNSAERVKAMKRAKSTEWRHDESCDLEKAFKTIVNRTSWLISEMEVGAQDEVSGSSRGTVETRRRLGIVFELLQRNIAIIEFLIDAAGDQLVADSDATDSAGAAVPLIVQTFVEMLMLLMRDYGRPESVMNQLVKLNFPELTQIHPWRVVGPLTGILITLLTPAARDGTFEGWQLVFHKMLKSPRCSWDVSTLLHAVSTLNIEELVEKRLAFTVEFKLQRLRAEEWKPLLMSLAEANRASPKKSNNGLTPPMGASPPQNANSPAVGAANALEDVSTSDEDDDALCTICCVDEVNVTFVPCGHRSCRPCIERQLQGNQKTCFFCKTPVTSLTECTGTDAPSYPMPPRQPTLPRVIGTPTTPHTGFPLFPEIP